MAKYKLVVKASATKELDRIPQPDLKRILQRIAALADEPRPVGCLRLSNRDEYRIRQGNYRILYSIQDDILIVCVVKVAHRKEVYRD